MINRLLEFSVRQRLLVFLGTLVLAFTGTAEAQTVTFNAGVTGAGPEFGASYDNVGPAMTVFVPVSGDYVLTGQWEVWRNAASYADPTGATVTSVRLRRDGSTIRSESAFFNFWPYANASEITTPSGWVESGWPYNAFKASPPLYLHLEQGTTTFTVGMTGSKDAGRQGGGYWGAVFHGTISRATPPFTASISDPSMTCDEPFKVAVGSSSPAGGVFSGWSLSDATIASVVSETASSVTLVPLRGGTATLRAFCEKDGATCSPSGPSPSPRRRPSRWTLRRALVAARASASSRPCRARDRTRSSSSRSTRGPTS